MDKEVLKLFSKPQIYILCSYPGIGLSTFALRIAKEIVKHKIVYYLFNRNRNIQVHPKRVLVSYLCGVSVGEFDYFIASENEYKKAKELYKKITKLNIGYSDYFNEQRLKETKNKGLIVIDNLQSYTVFKGNTKPFTFDGAKIIPDKYDMCHRRESNRTIKPIALAWLNYLKDSMNIPVIGLFTKCFHIRPGFISYKQIGLEKEDLQKINFGSLTRLNYFDKKADNSLRLRLIDKEGKKKLIILD